MSGHDIAGGSSITIEQAVSKLKGYYDSAMEEMLKADKGAKRGLVDDAIVHYKKAQRILNEACLTPVPSNISGREAVNVKSLRQKISLMQSKVSRKLRTLNQRTGGTSKSKG